MERARPAVAADAARLIELCGEALAEISSQRGGPQLARDVLGDRSVPEAVSGALEDRGRLVVAGEIDGSVLGIGVVSAGAAGRPALVEVLYVEPGARGVGLGEAVMDAMAGWAESAGCAGIDAVALPGSRLSKAFFESNGMVARALVMHRELRP